MKPQLDKFVDAVIASLETGIAPWRQGWTKGCASLPLRADGERFNGINRLVLSVMGDIAGYSCPTWFTYNQAAEIGAQVRRGEKGTQALLYSTSVKNSEDGGEDTVRRYAKVYSVFNGDQIDGLPEALIAPPRRERPAIESLDTLLANFPVKIIQRGDKAYYSHTHDHIVMPHFEAFESYDEWIGTALHEAAHASGHVSRLNRSHLDRSTDLGKATEELVAEITALQVANLLNLPPSQITMDNHMAYIGYWAEIIKRDRSVITDAAIMADKAANFIMGYLVSQSATTSPVCEMAQIHQ